MIVSHRKEAPLQEHRMILDESCFQPRNSGLLPLLLGLLRLRVQVDGINLGQKQSQ